MRWLLWLLVCFLITPIATAQDQKNSFKVFFRTGNAVIDEGYDGNGARLRALTQRLDSLLKDSTVDVSCVEVAASASPTGSYAINVKLVNARLSAMERYVCRCIDLPKNIIQKNSLGIAYGELRNLVAATSMPHRDETLSILDNVPEIIYNDRGEWVDGCRRRLMNLRGGRVWSYLEDHIFPQLQSSSVAITVYFAKRDLKPLSVPDVREVQLPIADDKLDLLQIPIIEPSVSAIMPERVPLFALKTNLLYDAVSALNVELEVPIGNRWSVAGEVVFPWWRSKSANLTMQLLTGTVQGRYWFGDRAGREVLTGWNAGVYFGGGMFDVQLFDPKGIQGEFFIAAGVSCGFAHSIGRNLRLEYALGVGFMQTNYREYKMTRNTRYGDIKVWKYPWETSRNSWFGPTKLSVSLVWLLKHNTKRGVMR